MNNYLKTAHILLVSSKPTHRSGVRKILCDLGADNHNIEVASDYTQALERLKKSAVNIVVADDDLSETEFGIDIIALHEMNNPVTRTRMFILMSGEITPFLESDFTLRGGDVIIRKPFTNAAFTDAVKEALQKRDSLPKDETVSMDVLDALRNKDVEGALRCFEGFPDQNSAQALFCKAKIYEFDNDHVRSFKNYAKAAEKNPDLKTLMSAVQEGILARRFDQMEGIVETWINKFPIYDKSVPDITRALVYNMRFELLNKLVKDFSGMKVSEPLVKAPLAAALVVSAIAWLEKGNIKKAVDCAERGIRMAGHRSSILIRGFEVLRLAGAKDKMHSLIAELMKDPVLSENKDLSSKLSQLIA